MKWSCITLAAFAALLLLPPTHSRHHALLLLCRPIYYSSWVHYSKTCTVGPPFCHELSLLSRRLAFDDEDGYNVYLGNIHCLFMNAFPMVSFARTPGDQIESSHPVPTSEKITGQPLYCLHQHNSPSYRVMFQNFE